MTTTMKVSGTLLTANADDRILTYQLLPYGEAGSTSLGKVTASAGKLTLPDQIVGNIEHDRTRPVARSVSITEDAAGLTAAFKVAATRAGDDLLTEAAEGLRPGVSVEIDDPVIRGGELLGGTLSGAGFVTTPAFPSALLVASDFGDLKDPDDPAAPVDGAELSEQLAQAVETILDALTVDSTEPEEKDKMTARLEARRRPTTTKPRLEAAAHEVYAMLAGAAPGTAALTAALSQITQANAFDVVQVPQYLGEVWSGVAYEQEFAPLLGHADLVSPKIIGWRFKDGKTPVVGNWDGAPNQVPSNAVELETVEQTASRKAAGWNVDRIHRDFPNPEFWAAFHRLSAESYSKQIDLECRAFILDENNTHTVTVAYDPDSIPAGVGIAAAKIVKGALALKAAQKGKATFAVLGLDLYEQWLYTRQEDALIHLLPTVGLSGADLDGIKVVGTDQVPDGTARVGVRQVATLHELGGASPLRVSTEDIAVGNLTEALFGYWGIFRHDKRAIVDVIEDEL